MNFGNNIGLLGPLIETVGIAPVLGVIIIGFFCGWLFRKSMFGGFFGKLILVSFGLATMFALQAGIVGDTTHLLGILEPVLNVAFVAVPIFIGLFIGAVFGRFAFR